MLTHNIFKWVFSSQKFFCKNAFLSMTDNPFTMQTMINPCRYDQIRAIWPQIWKTSTCDTVQKVNPIQMQSSIMKLLMLIFCSSWVRVPVTQPEGNFWRCNLWWWCCVHLMNIFFMSIALSQGYNHWVWDRLFLPLSILPETDVWERWHQVISE